MTFEPFWFTAFPMAVPCTLCTIFKHGCAPWKWVLQHNTIDWGIAKTNSPNECQGIGTKNQSHQKNVKAKDSISSAHVWAHILLAIVCDFILQLCLVFCFVPMFRWVVKVEPLLIILSIFNI
jgi:hypothetical protein